MGPPTQAHGQLVLLEPTVIDFAVNDTYQKITGNWDGSLLSHFEFDAVNDLLRYTGPDGRYVLVNGSSDLKVSKIASTCYALFINGVLAPGAETPHDFNVPNKTEGIGITAIAELHNGDELEVFAKINDATADMTTETLRVTFWGELR